MRNVRDRGRQFIVICMLLWFAAAAPPHAVGQDTDTLVLRIGHVTGHVGSLVEIPIGIDIPSTDSLDGFLIAMALSRNDLVYFEVDTVEQDNDTIYVCQFDTMGTLASGWEHVQARSVGGKGLDLRLSGLSDIGTGMTPGIPSNTSGTLIKIFSRIKPDVPDTMSDRVVYLNVHRSSISFSNQDGALIDPLSLSDGSITVERGAPGDVNCDGNINPTDAVYIVNYVYKNWQILCSVALADLNCDLAANPVDVVLLVNYIYKNWAIPPCQAQPRIHTN
jgi:hypothetical protein